MNQESRTSLAIGLAAALLAGFGVAPVSAQEEAEGLRERAEGLRDRVSVLLSGSGGYLGVQITDVDEERASDLGMAQPHGVFISEVVAEGPADEAGLEDGDVIVRWNGERLESVAQLQRLSQETPPGREVQLAVLRDGAEREIAVELGSRRSMLPRIVRSGRVVDPIVGGRGLAWVSPPRVEIQRAPSGESVVFFGRPRLGVSVQGLGEQLADYFGVEGGVLVTSVTEDSPAAEGGLQAGDVIVAVGDEEVDSRGDLTRALSDLEEGEVSVRVVRDGAERTFTVELEERDGVFRWRRGDGDGEIEAFEFGPIDWDFDFEFRELELPVFEIPAIDISRFDRASFGRVALRV